MTRTSVALMAVIVAVGTAGCSGSDAKVQQCNAAAAALRSLGSSIAALGGTDAAARVDAVNKVNAAGLKIGTAYQKQPDATAKAATRSLGIHLVQAGQKAITDPLTDADAQGLLADIDTFDTACGIKVNS